MVASGIAKTDKDMVRAKLEKSVTLSGRLIRAPGIYGFNNINEALVVGAQIRDELVHRYPLLPEAVDIFVQMCSTREWTISGQPRMVPRAVEAINNAQTITIDGFVEYGFEQFLKRQARDYVCVGRRTYVWTEDGDLTYVDPCHLSYEINTHRWYNDILNVKYGLNDVVVEHPKPIGGTGDFLSPIFSVIQTAALAWLIREHDTAAIDGRKLRDIIIVGSESVAKQIATAIEDTMELWDGKPSPEELSIPIVFAEGESPDVTKIFTRLGLSEIPVGFDRGEFQFEYVNELAGALGLPLRRIWNSEKATNRALEEVQEQRQEQTGPPVFVRSTQRLLNGRNGIPSRFGRSTRFGFIEEVDTASRSVNAEVLKKYAEGLKIFAEVFGGKVNGDALLAWLQSEGILPEDLDLITDIGTMQASDTLPVPTDGNIQRSSDPKTSAIVSEKSFALPGLIQNGSEATNFLDHGEIVMNSDGKVIERRNKVYSFTRVLEKALEVDPEFIESLNEQQKPVDFEDALIEARMSNKARFLTAVQGEKSFSPVLEEIKIDVLDHIDELTPMHYRKIFTFLDTIDKEKGKAS